VSREHGVALIVAVLLLVAVAAFGAIMAGSMAASDLTDSGYQGSSVEALFAAESGLERAIKRFATGTACGALTDAQTVSAGRTFSVTAGVTTAFDGATTLETSQCRVQSTGAVSGTSASRQLQAILDRNILVRRNSTFDSPAGAGNATGWTATKWDYNGGTNTIGTPTGLTCGRAIYALHSRASGGSDASAIGQLVDTTNGLFTVTGGNTVTVRFNLRAIRVGSVNSNTNDTNAGLTDPGGAAADVKVWVRLVDSALVISDTAVANVIREAVVNPGAPLNTRVPGATPTTQGFPGDYPACDSFYATGTPSNKRQVTVTVGGAGTRTITTVIVRIFIAKGRGIASEAWVDNIELFENSAAPVATVGGGRLAEWRDCAVSSCP